MLRAAPAAVSLSAKPGRQAETDAEAEFPAMPPSAGPNRSRMLTLAAAVQYDAIQRAAEQRHLPARVAGRMSPLGRSNIPTCA